MPTIVITSNIANPQLENNLPEVDESKGETNSINRKERNINDFFKKKENM